ncbi:hypothetical protein Tco_1128171 [Tanacetum coccineum]
MNYYERNPCYDSNYSGIDQLNPYNFPSIREKTCAEFLAEERAANINTQPMQYSVVHQPPQEETSLEFLQDKRNLINSVQTFLRKFNRFSFYEMPKVVSLAWETISEIEHAFEDKQYQPEGILELFRKLHDDVQNIHEELAEYINTPSWNRPTISCDDDDDEYSFATQEYLMTCSTAITPDPPKTDSLIMVDKHLDTIPETESDEFIKSSVENLVQNPSESEDEYLDKEINSSKFNPTHNKDLDSTPKDVRFDAESYLLESLVNRDTLMASPPKIDFLLDEFAGELTRLQSIPPGIDNINLDPEANSNTIIESLPISVDALREEIDILHSPDDSIPPGIESDDFDSEDDDNSTSLPEFESFHVDYPDSGDSTIDLVEDIPVDVPNILPTYPVLQLDLDFIPSNDLGSDIRGYALKSNPQDFLLLFPPVIDTLLPFSSENEDKVFNHGVLASKNKSPPSSSHRGLKSSKLFHHKSPMLIHGDNTPNLGVRLSRMFEASRARGFFRSLELQILSFISGIQYPNLID